ncbi:MAG TPA: polysaccharide pyruvyl transferase family protein [Anaerohalosphaeraceae bacterium]|jgi:hypothetical protein|nr:polysaccharide pyruvyl transferase family protein [Anaerohalosphaeraceae bacterium]HRT49898.1 polysaccharide pyruvyl transferase family protein [Anaerohalosphaeraceae bacterium]HRT86790.1 polysaccharide pyruvyl transferase family protein [Anaerohalosphaeraceae bacterium]
MTAKEVIRLALSIASNRVVPRWLDRRCRFHDLVKVRCSKRMARSPLIQFYSSVDNIGNYLPILGIQKLLGHTPDTWCMHDRKVDFDFINANYKGALIGGAGLLHKCFQPFWEGMAEHLRIPAIIWGIGGCFHFNNDVTVVERSIVQRVLQRCDLVNVRDDITADYYDMRNVSITPCPTIAYVAQFRHEVERTGKVLFSSHEELVPRTETVAIKEAIRAAAGRFLFTDNIQKVRSGLNDIIRRYYCKSSIVVTTRLHGAIIAYGMSIPYVAFAWDEKLRAFNRLYGNGVLADSPNLISDLLLNRRYDECLNGEPRIDLVEDFARRVLAWMASL